jgi:hypothetical protein
MPTWDNLMRKRPSRIFYPLFANKHFWHHLKHEHQSPVDVPHSLDTSQNLTYHQYALWNFSFSHKSCEWSIAHTRRTHTGGANDFGRSSCNGPTRKILKKTHSLIKVGNRLKLGKTNCLPCTTSLVKIHTNTIETWHKIRKWQKINKSEIKKK